LTRAGLAKVSRRSPAVGVVTTHAFRASSFEAFVGGACDAFRDDTLTCGCARFRVDFSHGSGPHRLVERLPGDHYFMRRAGDGVRENLAPAGRVGYRKLRRARMKSKAEMMEELRSMLADVFAAKASGQAYGRLARAHGYVDGYMRALLELGCVTKSELVELVNAERERSSDAVAGVTGALAGAAA
jgi:hypothetical protein